jgi:hypothetical protein
MGAGVDLVDAVGCSLQTPFNLYARVLSWGVLEDGLANP